MRQLSVPFCQDAVSFNFVLSEAADFVFADSGNVRHDGFLSNGGILEVWVLYIRCPSVRQQILPLAKSADIGDN